MHAVCAPRVTCPLQEHFYLEPNASIVIPGENDEYLSYSSTQASCCTTAITIPIQNHGAHLHCRPASQPLPILLPARRPDPVFPPQINPPHPPSICASPPPPQCPDKHQKDICHVLGVPMHKVVVKTKRLGECCTPPASSLLCRCLPACLRAGSVPAWVESSGRSRAKQVGRAPARRQHRKGGNTGKLQQSPRPSQMCNGRRRLWRQGVSLRVHQRRLRHPGLPHAAARAVRGRVCTDMPAAPEGEHCIGPCRPRA